MNALNQSASCAVVQNIFEINSIASQIIMFGRHASFFMVQMLLILLQVQPDKDIRLKISIAQLGAIHHIFLDGIKTILWRVLLCDPASICYSPPYSPEDSYGLYQFTDRMSQCRPDAAKACLRCRYTLNNPAWLMLIRVSRPCPPRCFQDGFMNHVAFSIRML